MVGVIHPREELVRQKGQEGCRDEQGDVGKTPKGKQGQVMWEEYRYIVTVCRTKVGKAKAPLELSVRA